MLDSFEHQDLSGLTPPSNRGGDHVGKGSRKRSRSPPVDPLEGDTSISTGLPTRKRIWNRMLGLGPLSFRNMKQETRLNGLRKVRTRRGRKKSVVSNIELELETVP